MLWQHALFVGLVVGTELFFTALSVLNLRHGERTVEKESDWVTATLEVENVDRLLDYHRMGTALGLLRQWVFVGALLFVLYSGLFADAVAAVETLGLGPVGNGLVFLVGAVLVGMVASLPFDAVDTFAVEEVFGFNRQSPRLWVRDKLVGLAVATVLGTLVVGAILLVVTAIPDWWWVGAWALVLSFSLAGQVIYPRVIAPLFYDFEPIEDGELREAVEATFEREYGLVYAPARAINHVWRLEDRLGTLRTIRDHLRPGGRFACNTFVPDFETVVAEYGTEHGEEVVVDGETYRVVTVTTLVDELEQVTRIHRELYREGELIAERDTPFALIPKREFELLFELAGFESWTAYGGFDRDPLEDADQEQVWVARA